jgi:AcrR family transcriptional regulator
MAFLKMISTSVSNWSIDVSSAILTEGGTCAEPTQDARFPKGFSLPDVLQAELDSGPKLPRSEATRRRFLIAAAELIQETGFNDLKVADICRRAGFAHGTFYLHWQDRRGIAHDVLTAFMSAIRQHRPARQPGLSFYARLVAGHLYYIDVYRRNVGLMRCQGQLADQLEEFAQIGLHANMTLARRVVRAVDRELGSKSREPEAQRLATALGCIALVDKLLHDVFARGLDMGLDDHALAANMSRTWYRALMGSDLVVC